ncbi:MAG: HAD-IIA family hydrolase [Candidatus Nanohaloarchaea archaeon]|nr:HAD-IIA family hydrolase [Candidatus Nanohaloarchaea archaeon]
MVDYEKSLEHVQNFVFDLDSTVWRWNELIPGVKKTVQKLKAKGKNIFYVTDNSLLTRQGYAEKLTKLGLKTSVEDIVNSGYVAAQQLSKKGVNKALTIGEEPLVAQLREEDIEKSEEADHVVVGLDRNYTYWKMAKAAERVREGATLWATGHGNSLQTKDKFIPGENAIMNSIKTAAEVTDYKNFGKPSDYMVEIIKEELPVHPTNTILIGDSLESDIAIGKKMGLDTGLVLGGRSSREDIKGIEEDQAPDYVFTEFSRILRKV